MRLMTLGRARAIAGSLGFPSKMPGSSYGLPVRACQAGEKLAQVEGSACSVCYAMKDAYTWPNALEGQLSRLDAIHHPRWVDAMVRLLLNAHRHRYRRIDLGKFGLRKGQRHRLNEMGHHRWHDSGDLQSVDHLARICRICERTPLIRHWLPTQELGMVAKYLTAGGKIPDNLLIRVSSIMIDDAHRRRWPTSSSVFTEVAPAGAHVCPAPHQGHRCMSCRACWSPDVRHVAYAAH